MRTSGGEKEEGKLGHTCFPEHQYTDNWNRDYGNPTVYVKKRNDRIELETYNSKILINNFTDGCLIYFCKFGFYIVY